MSVDELSDDLVRRVAADLRERYDLDEEGLRALGARLAGSRSDENVAFAERFLETHRETFDRLSK